jgi:hypothetical protein
MGGYQIIPITSRYGVAYEVDYIPLHPGVNDLHHLLFKRYFEENDEVGICGVGIRLSPKLKVRELPFPVRQSGKIILSSEEDLDYMFGDAWEGVIIRRRLPQSDFKHLLIIANQILERFALEQLANA